MELNEVTYEINEGIGTITFSSQSQNALPSFLLHKLAETIHQASADEACKVIVLKSAGNRTFCAGASFDELININSEEEGKQFFSGFAHVINAMRTCNKIIIGRVQGKAVGGGVGLAAACDYTFATQYADIKLSELALGIGPFVISPVVERKLGQTTTFELSLQPTHFKPAQWAFSKGLYTELFDDIEKMDEAVHQLATQLAAYSPLAMKELKQVFWQGTEHWNNLLVERAAISGKLVTSHFTKNYIQQFKQKQTSK